MGRDAVPCADNGISSPAYLQLIGGSTGVQVVATANSGNVMTES